MKEDLKISIIIPVYNAEKYISRCIESWLNQTYSNFELVLINDGSTDQSQKICEDYQNSDNRIKLINTENFGVSHARNVGLNSVQGDLVGFCDADDYVHCQALEIVAGVYYRYKNDIIIYDYKRINQLKDKDISIKYDINNVQITTYTSAQLIQYIYYKPDKVVWDKFFKKSFIDSIKFNEQLTHGEDLHWLLNVFINNIEYQNIACIPLQLYYYIINIDSATMDTAKKFDKYGELKSMKAIELNEKLFKSISTNNINDYILGDLFRASLSNCFLAKKENISIEINVLNKLKSYIRKYYKIYFFKNKKILIKDKIKNLIKLIYIYI